MRKCLLAAAVAAVVAFGSTPAAAQTTAAKTQTSAPQSGAGWYGTVAGGVAAAAEVGFGINGEVGRGVWPNIDISVEGGWFSNVVTNERKDSASLLAGVLSQTQGQPASANVDASAGYGMVNARYLFSAHPRYQPYALAGVGFAVTSANTTFTLGGTDVTGSVSQLGLTLGTDLSGHSTHAAINAGAGVVIPYGTWRLDVSYRFTPIFTSGAATYMNRFNVGVGRRF